MSAQNRYRTLIEHIGRIYAASDNEKRTELLQAGLDQIVSVVDPQNAQQWSTVGADSDRLLKVWVAKEHDEAATAVVEQLTDILRELIRSSTEENESSVVTVSKVEEPVVHIKADPVVTVKKDEIKPEPVVAVKKEEVVAVKKVEVPVLVVETDDEAEAEVNGEDEGEVDAEDEEDEGEGEGSVIEPDAEAEGEEDDEGEIDYIAFRGVENKYLWNSATKKVYAIVTDDDGEEAQGEEIGAVVNGKVKLNVKPYVAKGRTYWLEPVYNKIHATISGSSEVGDEIGELVGGKVQIYASK